MPSRNLLSLCLVILFSWACYLRADRNQYATTVSDAMEIISHNYLEHVSQRELYENAMTGMTSGLDPYSGYIPPEDFGYFKEELDQEFGGIGILVEFDRDTNRPTVVSPLVDTPAAQAGVRAGDTILAIDGQDTSSMTFRDTLELIRGKPGEIVALTVLHVGDQEPEVLEIERAIIPVESVLGDRRLPDGSWDFHLESEPRIVYVRLVTFGENSVEELRSALQKTSGDAILLDLRDNAGGLLTAAVEICDQLITDGTIVTIRGRDGEIRDHYMATPQTTVAPGVPIAVLVNNFSASASEIVAACLQDHGRAAIVGARTWGKGTVQNVIELEGGKAALKLTTASYWRPSGENIHRLREDGDDDQWGVQPSQQLRVPLTEEEADAVRQARRRKDTAQWAPSEDPDGDTDTATDPQLQKAVEYLQQRLDAISPAADREAA
jgi:carboxyl-terminal processing protease